MTNLKPEESAHSAAFGQRKVTPRVCIADNKKHLRTFLAEVLEDLGFITCECAEASEMAATLDTQLPDLVVLGLSHDGIEAGKILEILAEKAFGGSVLAIGLRDSIMVRAVRQLGEEYGIAMLPPLLPPFSAETLRAGIATFLPVAPAPSPAVDVAEALKAGWLELWYQRKIDARTLVPCGAEALVRMRHPAWGVVPPAYFLPDDRDPHFRGLSEFLVGRAIEDWHYLLEQQGPIDLSINLPISVLEDGQAVRDLCRRMPGHPAFGGLILEIDSTEAIGNLDLVVDVAKQIRLHNIAIAIDGLGVDWPKLMDLESFPFVELKVSRQFISGCAGDRLKQTVCRRIVELGQASGVRSLAAGVETRADFLTAQAMGFDLVQGYLFGKPMGVKKFARAAAAPPLLMSS
jgi:EAL domain-containing protein (putative c-di-GMP-specific phosphodiesterase class I)/CheY-like chemotaxis protein